MKRDDGILAIMMNTSGFGFSERGHKIEVANEDIQDKFLKTDKNAKGNTRKGVAILQRLGYGRVFGKHMATGEFAIDIEELGHEADEAARNAANANTQADAALGTPCISTKKQKKRKTYPTDDVALGLENMAKMLRMLGEECIASERKWMICGKRTSFDVSYKIANDPLKVDFFFSLPESASSIGFNAQCYSLPVFWSCCISKGNVLRNESGARYSFWNPPPWLLLPDMTVLSMPSPMSARGSFTMKLPFARVMPLGFLATVAFRPSSGAKTLFELAIKRQLGDSAYLSSPRAVP
ncbi:hypothetical protein Acr_17g0000720 [Actinidia rufa]|uniref:Uncharacterized protein n=1 Tax=Actinidia rufa TaxID=165716 RepID=A0A7J0G134_9ERIC|nr:hypothetical protein Acr_17g0000720 [Actinidia rufa]